MNEKFYIEPNSHVLVAGATGTGKSFLTEQYLKGYENVIKLDTKLECYERWESGISPWQGLEEDEDFEVCTTLEDCKKSTFKKIIFAPEFEEQTEETLNDFFHWIFLRQNTIVWIDELMSIGTVHKYPKELHRLMIMGRSKNVGVWSCTQRPSGIPTIVPSNSKYFFVFNLYNDNDRKKMVNVTGFPELARLPTGHNFWYCKMGDTRPILAYLDI